MNLLDGCVQSAAHQPSTAAPRVKGRANAGSPFVCLTCPWEAQEGPGQAGGGGSTRDAHGKAAEVLGNLVPYGCLL